MKDKEVIIEDVLAEMRKFDPKCNCHVDELVKQYSGENIFYDPEPIVNEMERRGLIFRTSRYTHSLEQH